MWTPLQRLKGLEERHWSPVVGKSISLGDKEGHLAEGRVISIMYYR